MITKFKCSAEKENQKDILGFIQNFQSSGELFGNGDRNKIKLFKLDGKTINIKSFKIPNIINKIAYKYFRKSKARRSFEYATILLEKGIGTPQPIAFLENFNFLGLKDSYYVSEHLVTELTYRELVEIPDYPDHLHRAGHVSGQHRRRFLAMAKRPADGTCGISVDYGAGCDLCIVDNLRRRIGAFGLGPCFAACRYSYFCTGAPFKAECARLDRA